MPRRQRPAALATKAATLLTVLLAVALVAAAPAYAKSSLTKSAAAAAHRPYLARRDGRPARRGRRTQGDAENRTVTSVTFQLLTGLTTYVNEERVQLLGNILSTKAAAAIIAAQHCEERNGVVIDALNSTAMEGCEDLHFGVTSYDTRSLQSLAVMSYLAGISDDAHPTSIVIGTSRSVTSLPVSVLANVNRVPVMSYWASSPDLDDNSVHEQFFRTIPADSATARATADLLVEYNIGHAGMIYVDDSYGDGFRESLVKEASARKIEVLAYSYEDSDVMSIEHAVNGLEQARLNVIVVIAFAADMGTIVKALNARGMIGPDRLVLFGDGLGAKELTLLVQETPELAPTLNATQIILALGGEDSNPVFMRLWKKWPEFIKYRELVNEHLPGGARYHDATKGVPDNLLGDNITLQIGEDVFTDPDVVKGFIYGTAYAYDAVAASCRAICMSYKDGAASDDPPPPTIIGGEDQRPTWLRGDALSRLFKDQKTFPFQGTSGLVKFDAKSGSRVPATATFKLQSLFIDPDTLVARAQEIGDWKANWTLSEEIVFPGGGSDPPLQIDLPPEDRHLVNPGLRAFAYGLEIVVTMVCIGLCFWVHANRRTQVVRKSQPEFLHLFLLGIIMSVSSLGALAYPYDELSGDPAAGAACNAFSWLLSLGSTITSTAIVLKLYRIMRIFNNPSLRLLLITASSLFRVMASVLLLNVVLLAVPTALSPIQWERTVVSTDKFGNPTESYAACKIGDSVVVRVFFWLVLVLHLLLYVVGATIAYRVRDVDSSFQEGKTLALAVIWQFQLYLLSAPILLAVSETETQIKFLIITLTVGLANVFALLFVMAPKVHAVWLKKKDPSDRQTQHKRVNNNKNEYYHVYAPRKLHQGGSEEPGVSLPPSKVGLLSASPAEESASGPALGKSGASTSSRQDTATMQESPASSGRARPSLGPEETLESPVGRTSMDARAQTSPDADSRDRRDDLATAIGVARSSSLDENGMLLKTADLEPLISDPRSGPYGDLSSTTSLKKRECSSASSEDRVDVA